GGPSYNWIDITGTGTNAGITEDDENVGPFNIGFVFPFYGDTFTTFRICSNGWISFTSAWTSFFNETLPNPSEPYNLIAPFWTDLNPSDSGAIYYDTTRQDTLIIEFHNVPDWGGSGYYTFEIILTKQGKFIYQYNSMTGILNYATTGIQNKDGTIGLNIAYNTPYIHDGLAVKIYNTQQWLSVNPKNDTITAGESTGVVIGFNTQELDTANYYATLHLKSNDIYHPDTIIPIRLKVLRDTIEVEEMPLVPKTFFIAQNHPNPFIGTTVIEYGIPNAAAVTINIYNILGQKVATLVNENKKAGFYTVKWNGKNGMGKKVATGIYFYRLDTHEYTATKKMYLIR
ncbi:MAG: T9SS type A sorting domain-containing protein, partial [Candidatus Stahlbacteria bacterium]|nr:T9SS type A sorting domain-containing protein [Candidatus Stahlbacteria bacterium]